MNAKILGLFAVGLLAGTADASTVITFEDLSAGATLSNQYASLGVIFAPNAFSGAGGPTTTWATNTDMTIVSSSGADVGGLGTPSLVSGNILRSFNGWLVENGDPSFNVLFSTAVSSFSADFAGVSNAASTRLFAYDGDTLVATAIGPTAGQFTLSLTGGHFTRIAITPGDYNDWVGVDNITFEQVAVPPAVPLPAAAWLLLSGLGGLGLLSRRRKT